MPMEFGPRRTELIQFLSLISTISSNKPFGRFSINKRIMQKKDLKHSPTVDGHGADRKKLAISNSISNSIINSSKVSTALPTASNSIPNSDSTTAIQRLKQLTGCLLTMLHPTYGKKVSSR